MKYLLTAIILTIVQSLFGNAVKDDSTKRENQKRFTIGGYVDAYYAYNFNKPEGDQPYYVSMTRQNEITINLAFVDVRVETERLRARVAPGFGTYMNSNYTNEQGTLKHLVEASVGMRLFNRENIWLDAGVIGSPFTNEGPVSKNQLAYTRSLSAEYVPYYLSGIKLTLPLSGKLTTCFYLINGWQQITDQNENKALTTQFEFHPSDKLLINWNTFIGKETTTDSISGMRYFSDVYFILTQNKFTMSTCWYLGNQVSENTNKVWWQANLITKYHFTNTLSITGRVEYFDDKKRVMVSPVAGPFFNCSGASLGINQQVGDQILLRAEGKYLKSSREIFVANGEAVNNAFVITAGICAGF